MISKILIVEDEVLMLKALEFRLRKDGYEVHTAADGAVALDLIQAQSFDLIITDIMLPFVGGLEIVSKVKGNPQTKDTPVIMLSAVGLENIVLEAFQLGADDFITKPFNLSELSIRVRKHVKQPSI
ncbi:response regulator transcription factor [Daejeonella oryzae]|uniref:response regulator transcription factor n=1 Tax=Daejeonella oryzae TaxID=1122943 RepID=UPI0004150C64|nr:response regulator [Daejeonella oryzae]